MGQYHITVNLDKREYLHPHDLGDGLKLAEQGYSGPGGIATAIHVLLAVSAGRGGGDYDHVVMDGEDICGRWGGDRIAIIGDYYELDDLGLSGRGDMTKSDGDYSDIEDLYGYTKENFRDITPIVRAYMQEILGFSYEEIDSGWIERSRVGVS